MSIEIEDFLDVRNKATKLGYDQLEGITLLPLNFEIVEDAADIRNYSTAATVKVLFRNEGIKLNEIKPASSQIAYVQNNSFDWIAPTLFVTSALILNDPTAFSVALNVISNYITDFFKGIPGSKNAKIVIVVEKSDRRTCKAVKFEGASEDFKELVKVIEKIVNE